MKFIELIKLIFSEQDEDLKWMKWAIVKNIFINQPLYSIKQYYQREIYAPYFNWQYKRHTKHISKEEFAVIAKINTACTEFYKKYHRSQDCIIPVGGMGHYMDLLNKKQNKYFKIYREFWGLLTWRHKYTGQDGIYICRFKDVMVYSKDPENNLIDMLSIGDTKNYKPEFDIVYVDFKEEVLNARLKGWI